MGGAFAKDDWTAFLVSYIPLAIELAFALRWTAPMVVKRWRQWKTEIGPWWGFSAPLGAYMWVFMYALGGTSYFLWWRNAEAVVGYDGYAAVLGLLIATAGISLLWQGPFLYGPSWWPFAAFIAALAFAGSLAATVIIGINAAKHSGTPVLWASFALIFAFAFFMFLTLVVVAYMSWNRYRIMASESFFWRQIESFGRTVTGPNPEIINTQFSTRAGVLLNNGQSLMGQALQPRRGVPRV